MRSFLSHTPSTTPRSMSLAGPGRSLRHRQSGVVGVFGGAPGLTDAEAAQLALLYRSEAFAEDLGPGYAGMTYAANAAAAATAAR